MYIHYLRCQSNYQSILLYPVVISQSLYTSVSSLLKYLVRLDSITISPLTLPPLPLLLPPSSPPPPPSPSLPGLKTEGLYRKSGEHSKIRKLLLSFNQDPRGVVIDEDSYSVHDVTGTLKQFFRTLPDPLLTHKLYQPFIHASCMNIIILLILLLLLILYLLIAMTSGHENQMYQLQSLIDQLPDVNKETLKRLIGHLLK